MSLFRAVFCFLALLGAFVVYIPLADTMALALQRLIDPRRRRRATRFLLLHSTQAMRINAQRRKDEEDKAKSGKIKQDRLERRKQRKAIERGIAIAIANSTAAPEAVVKMGPWQRVLSFLSLTASPTTPAQVHKTSAEKTSQPKTDKHKAKQRSWLIQRLMNIDAVSLYIEVCSLAIPMI